MKEQLLKLSLPFIFSCAISTQLYAQQAPKDPGNDPLSEIDNKNLTQSENFKTTDSSVTILKNKQQTFLPGKTVVYANSEKNAGDQKAETAAVLSENKF